MEFCCFTARTCTCLRVYCTSLLARLGVHQTADFPHVAHRRVFTESVNPLNLLIPVQSNELDCIERLTDWSHIEILPIRELRIRLWIEDFLICVICESELYMYRDFCMYTHSFS